MERIVDWLRGVRVQFLSLSVVLVFLGTSIAVSEGLHNPGYSVLALLGLLLLHASVNLLNDYSDYHSGIDFATNATPFSGGSGMLIAGRIAPSAALCVGIACVVVNIVIGLYFVKVTNWQLMPLLLVGVFTVCCYTDVLARCTLGEIFAGLGLGLLPVLGCYFIQVGHYSAKAFVAGIPAGLLTFNLLLLNEFPDYPADCKGGRKNLLMLLGVERAGRLYAFVMALVYISIATGVVLHLIPGYCLLGLLTIPVALKSIKWAWNHTNDLGTVIPALQANVIANLGTQTLLGVGFLVSSQG
ncbi:prenyltransferase [Desulfomonile tiedjei]|uniref:1,4-dihydroxy-2-naphthoate octaprenyltransferase n=1 Tax=Desulfomonile tiedjei (strain ATCC 49306 / DSM 6799 / DCB-1) TaxID=706587 RepID=I4CDQ2_DESTA|nr:prenyltransferase [Desulfomonile tiedjei]AFM27693.1 1,4-dihydroxy-2-naphthoate octaprenyltransferase [Desulfomonile tiedjei DSM 6799]